LKTIITARDSARLPLGRVAQDRAAEYSFNRGDVEAIIGRHAVDVVIRFAADRFRHAWGYFAGGCSSLFCKHDDPPDSSEGEGAQIAPSGSRSTREATACLMRRIQRWGNKRRS
jgi:hypothetical protein